MGLRTRHENNDLIMSPSRQPGRIGEGEEKSISERYIEKAILDLNSTSY